MLKIRSFRKGSDEQVWVNIFNAVFTDCDDIRSMTLQEMKKLEVIKLYKKLGFKVERRNIVYRLTFI